jgi:hypothetical protein
VLPTPLDVHQYNAVTAHTPTVYNFAANEVSLYVVTSGFYDVRVWDYAASENGYWAWTWCAIPATYGGSAASHTRYCYPQELIFNLTYKSSYYITQAKTNAIACHEMGHTLGLRHFNTSSGCMKSPPTGSSYNYTDITSHEDTHLKDGY